MERQTTDNHYMAPIYKNQYQVQLHVISHYLKLVGDKKNRFVGFVFEPFDKAFSEDMSPDMDIHCGERVVHQVDVLISVQGPGQGQSLLLPSAQIYAPLPNLNENVYHAKVQNDLHMPLQQA